MSVNAAVQSCEEGSNPFTVVPPAFANSQKHESIRPAPAAVLVLFIYIMQQFCLHAWLHVSVPDSNVLKHLLGGRGANPPLVFLLVTATAAFACRCTSFATLGPEDPPHTTTAETPKLQAMPPKPS